jgi:hypothetical protein
VSLLSVERGSVAGQSETAVYNRKVLNLPAIGVCIFSPKRPKRGTQRGLIICHMTDTLIGEERLVGQRSARHQICIRRGENFISKTMNLLTPSVNMDRHSAGSSLCYQY